MAPKGWLLKPLSELGKIVPGGTPDTTEASYWGGTIPWCTPTDITALNERRYITETERTITEAGLKNSAAVILPKNSVIVCTRATIGICAINKVPMATNQGFKSIIPKDVVPEYLYYLMMTLKPELIRLAVGSTFGEVSKKDFSEIKSFVPPYSEQKKIADVLVSWDAAEEILKRVLMLKRKYLAGLQEQLVNEHAIKTISLGKIGRPYGGLNGKTKEDFCGVGKPYITYKNIFQNTKVDCTALEKVRVQKGEKQNTVEYGDILFTTSSETPEEVGMSSVMLDRVGDVYLNSFCFGYRLNDFKTLLPEYARYFFRGSKFREEMYKLAQGYTRYNISKNKVMEVCIKAPPIAVQEKAARLFAAMEEEIAVLSKQLEKIRGQKHALMHKLIIGEIPVKI